MCRGSLLGWDAQICYAPHPIRIRFVYSSASYALLVAV